MSMIIMVAAANNDSNNIMWLFAVIHQSVCCFIFGYFLGDRGVGWLLLQSCRPPCFQWYLGSASVLVFSRGYLNIQERQYFKAFSVLFLAFIYHYIYIIIHFCLVFVYQFGVLTIATYVHYYSVQFCFPFFELLWDCLH